MIKYIKNLFSRRIKVSNNNSKEKKSTKVSGVNVNTEHGSGGIGSIGYSKEKEPALYTEDLALKELEFNQNASLIEGINDPEAREGLKVDYIKKRIGVESSAESNASSDLVKKKVEECVGFNCNSLNIFLSNKGFNNLFLPNNLCDEGTLLWPMNIQDELTYIHIAQFNLARLFIMAGWKLKIIIGDCGHNSSKGTAETKNNFTSILINFLEENRIKESMYSIVPLSQYFIRNSERDQIEIEQVELLNQFHIICDSIVWRDYKEEILKEYDDHTRYKIENRKLLNNIQPLLMWSVVASINQKCIDKHNGKVVIIAGQDEYKQWERIVNTKRRNNLSAVFIQELKTSDGKTMEQGSIRIPDHSSLRDKIRNNENLAKWLFIHFIELPLYGQEREQFAFCDLPQSQCKQQKGDCIKCLFVDRNYEKYFKIDEFVSYMYPKINAAN